MYFLAWCMVLSGHHDRINNNFLKVSNESLYPSGIILSSGASLSNHNFHDLSLRDTYIWEEMVKFLTVPKSFYHVLRQFLTFSVLMYISELLYLLKSKLPINLEVENGLSSLVKSPNRKYLILLVQRGFWNSQGFEKTSVEGNKNVPESVNIYIRLDLGVNQSKINCWRIPTAWTFIKISNIFRREQEASEKYMYIHHSTPHSSPLRLGIQISIGSKKNQ